MVVVDSGLEAVAAPLVAPADGWRVGAVRLGNCSRARGIRVLAWRERGAGLAADGGEGFGWVGTRHIKHEKPLQSQPSGAGRRGGQLEKDGGSVARAVALLLGCGLRFNCSRRKVGMRRWQGLTGGGPSLGLHGGLLRHLGGAGRPFGPGGSVWEVDERVAPLGLGLQHRLGVVRLDRRKIVSPKIVWDPCR